MLIKGRNRQKKNSQLIPPNQMNNPIHKHSFGRKPKANEHTPLSLLSITRNSDPEPTPET
jgi:hypothetical protein